MSPLEWWPRSADPRDAPSSIIDSAMVEKGQPTLSTVKAGQRGPGPAAYES